MSWMRAGAPAFQSPPDARLRALDAGHEPHVHADDAVGLDADALRQRLALVPQCEILLRRLHGDCVIVIAARRQHACATNEDGSQYL